MKCGGIFDLAVKEENVQNLETRMAESGFWEDQSAAQKIIDEWFTYIIT